jgi:hypothetical protein
MRTAVVAILMFTFTVSASDARERTVRTGGLACRTEPLIERVGVLRQASGGEWVAPYLMTVLNSGECTWLKAGTKVTVDGDRTENPNYTVVRPAGQTSTFVTFRRLLN